MCINTGVKSHFGQKVSRVGEINPFFFSMDQGHGQNLFEEHTCNNSKLYSHTVIKKKNRFTMES